MARFFIDNHININLHIFLVFGHPSVKIGGYSCYCGLIVKTVLNIIINLGIWKFVATFALIMIFGLLYMEYAWVIERTLRSFPCVLLRYLLVDEQLIHLEVWRL